MAEAVLQIVLENLASMMQKELGLLWGLEKEMEKLCSILTTIKAVLQDAEEKQVNDRAITNWLLKLNAAVYKADDILDEFATEASRLERKSSKVHTFLTCFHLENIPFRHKIAKKIKDVIERLDEIAKERSQFHLNEVVRERRDGIVEWRQTGSKVTPPRVYGRDEDKEKVVKCLVEDIIDCDDVSVYPIVGMGGLGKTTLAQLVYNDERVDRHFEPKIWVCVSDDFDVRRLIKAMIESATGNACPDLDLDPLQKRLEELLSGKRFLLVLDDVWNDDQDKWNKLKCVLTSTSKGASIVVTTRMKKVADVMGTLRECEHNLSSLSENDCWLLFKERAFSGEREEDPTIIAIGKEIVKKCGGVPLAVQALGSLMRDKSGEKQWLSVLESKIWDLPQNESSILPALRLGYTNLPLELRKCFVYCAIYPKDSVIERDELIQLWMANGYVSSTKTMELEDVGNKICEELYWRSLIQEVSRDNRGNIETFKMHDLVHDLAQSLIGDECCLPNGESSTNISRKACHVNLITSTRSCITVPETLYVTESLRTLLLTTTWGSPAEASSPLDFSRLRTLRVFSGALDDLTIVSSIGRLKHLRYLRLFSDSIKQLPVSICSLINLQTLNLEECSGLTTLPKTLSFMKNLRHLHLYHDSRLLYMPPNIGQMRCLKTLSLFIVGNNPGSQLVELQRLNLGGDLHIKHLERVVNLTHAEEVNFAGKHDLRYLSLSWDLENVVEQPESVEKVLEALKPHSNLEMLKLEGYNGTRFPDWISNMGNLTWLCLEGNDKIVELPHEMLQGLGSLQELFILNCEKFNSLSEGLQHLTSLERLEIVGCRDLVAFPDGIKHLHSLKSLKVYGCPNLVSSLEWPGNLTSLQSLRINFGTTQSSFPSTMQRLTNLKALVIFCRGPMLKRYEKEIGEEVIYSLHSKLNVVYCSYTHIDETE